MYGREDLIVWKADLTGRPYSEARAYNKQDADKVMDAMEARIKELESQLPKWISVKERVPKEGDLVLVMRPKAFRYKMDVIAWIYDYYCNDATHWMPLPSAPTTEKK